MIPYHRSRLTVNQLCLGYDVEDLLRLVRYRGHGAALTPGAYTDYFGIKTRLSYFTDQPSGQGPLQHHDQLRAGFPFPDDGLHAESVEYLGTCKALEAANSDDITIVEMGAGYAPWLVFSAHVARRLGKKRVRLVAVEAEAARHGLIQSHFADNEVPLPGTDSAFVTQIIHAAISDNRGSVTFGSAGIHDWGGAVQDAGEADYRGMQVQKETVPAMLIQDVLNDLPVIDLLHIDIQGWEARAIRASIDDICSRVKYMVIGTHSRLIEGELLAMLHQRGWQLMHEKPCQFYCELPTEDLCGATYIDGTQVWANRALEAQTNPPIALNAEDMLVAEQIRLFLQSDHSLDSTNGAEPESEIETPRRSTRGRVAAGLRKLLATMKA